MIFFQTDSFSKFLVFISLLFIFSFSLNYWKDSKGMTWEEFFRWLFDTLKNKWILAVRNLMSISFWKNLCFRVKRYFRRKRFGFGRRGFSTEGEFCLPPWVEDDLDCEDDEKDNEGEEKSEKNEEQELSTEE
ncbi:hypothetical protein [Mycoplasma parvum]|uniref:Uncharacterized protein n=1 Tax=Mycoplasma parvum str. Indiana TaxID=1403316 RepID=U5NF75_9MOLU|nr:hypothetical protein [Mycoplasma parvum]AGX88819.1 hypothetical protein PRV_00170 [Mycoplasma parvum str. Indiana]